MEQVLKEYGEAVNENIEASKAETEARARKQKAHYRLSMARRDLFAKEQELMEPTVTI